MADRFGCGSSDQTPALLQRVKAHRRERLRHQGERARHPQDGGALRQRGGELCQHDEVLGYAGDLHAGTVCDVGRPGHEHGEREWLKPGGVGGALRAPLPELGAHGAAPGHLPACDHQDHVLRPRYGEYHLPAPAAPVAARGVSRRPGPPPSAAAIRDDERGGSQPVGSPCPDARRKRKDPPLSRAGL
jgi:hypothetical protein